MQEMIESLRDDGVTEWKNFFTFGCCSKPARGAIALY
jgi:hypothetical protein